MRRVRGATRIVTAPPRTGTATTRTPYDVARVVVVARCLAAGATYAAPPTLSNATSNGAEPNVAIGLDPSHDVSATGYPDAARSDATYRSSRVSALRGSSSPCSD